MFAPIIRTPLPKPKPEICEGCSIFGNPVWETDVWSKGKPLDAAWFHYTAGVHPYKEKFLWCDRANVPGNNPILPLSDNFVGNLHKIIDKKPDPTLNQKQVEFHLKCLAGRLLTLVDAMVTSEAQNKAFKTYVKKEFREEFARVNKTLRDANSGAGEQDDPEELAVAEKEL